MSCLHLLSGNNNHDYFQFTIDLCHSADADKTQKLMQKIETALEIEIEIEREIEREGVNKTCMFVPCSLLRSNSS